ncbi:MAG: hypothetical protein PHV34_09880 [Verrucomicrobiae bacterium]|nr:hypothetical protein [Verrucomicrobiae bacterium]
MKIAIVILAASTFMSLSGQAQVDSVAQEVKSQRQLIGMGIGVYVDAKKVFPLNVIEDLRANRYLSEAGYDKIIKSNIKLGTWDIPFPVDFLHLSPKSNLDEETKKLASSGRFGQRPMIWMVHADDTSGDIVHYLTFGYQWKTLDREIFKDYLKGTFEILDGLRKNGGKLKFPDDWKLEKYLKPIDQ